MDDLERWRPEFPILSRSVYLINNSLGAMPRKTADSLAEYAAAWATRGVESWGDRWWDMPREVGDKIGQIIGAPAGSVSMHENVTTAQMVVLSAIPPPKGPRRKIVCLEMDFPSLIYLYRAHEDLGFELEVVPADADYSVPVDRVVNAIDDRTALVALSHVLFRSSYIMDPAPIVERAHAAGAPVVLDAYQSAGIIPLDVTKLGVDYCVGGCLKWLCGGPGNAFLYTRPDVRRAMKPRFTGWMANENPFAFDINAHGRRDDAKGMMNGTPAIPAYYAAVPGLDIIREVGVDRIREKSKRMTSRLLQLVDDCGFTSVASRDPERVAGTVAVNVPAGATTDAQPVSRVLIERGFLVDYRPGVGIRISPHFYNTFDEIEAIMSEMRSIVTAPPRALSSPSS